MTLSAGELGARLDESTAGVFLVDAGSGRIDANPSLTTLANSLGTPLADLSTLLFPEILAWPAKRIEPTRVISLGAGDRRRWFERTMVPLKQGDGDYLGVLTAVGPPDDLAARDRLDQVRREQLETWGYQWLPVRGQAMNRVYRQLRLAAASREAVTFLGEAGTGKQTLARVLHHQRFGATGAFVLLDCEALPPQTQREELRGRLDVANVHSPAALGLLRAPGPGTLCIREPLSLAADLQDDVARAADEGTLGLALVLCSRQPLRGAQASPPVTETFFHLASRLTIELPPLRERRAELEDYCQLILGRHAERAGTPRAALERSAIAALADYDWPGNLSELEVLLDRAAERGESIEASHLPRRVQQPTAPPGAPAGPAKQPPLDEILAEIERRLLKNALARASGNKSKAAQFLGISRVRLHRRMEQLGFSTGE